MIITGFIVALLAVLAIVAAAKAPEWNFCPRCRHFHRGNVMLPSLPPDADGTVSTQMCIACQMPDEQSQPEIEKEFSC